MILKERLNRLRTIVKTEKKVKVAELSQRLDVTEETIRRDLERLDLEGLITRTHGGAVLKVENMFDRLGYIHRSKTNVEEKRKIAQMVAAIIPPQATLFADASSTVMEALILLADRDDLTVLTNSIPVLSSLNQSKLNIMSTGGANNRISCSLQGIIARNTIMNYHVDFVLTSCKGIKLEEGAYDSREGETEIKQLMIGRAQRTVMLADHTKFDRTSFVKYCGFQQIDILVTDCQPSEEWMELFEEFQIHVLYPKVEETKAAEAADKRQTGNN